MSTGRWEQIKSLFHAAMEVPTHERKAFLELQCKGDTELRQEVESLMKSASCGVVKTGGAAHALGLDNTSGIGGQTRSTMSHMAPITEMPGTVIGPYKLLQVIGEGGFGTVFLAEQHQPVRRRVALKIIKLGMDTKSVIARFEAERQALAVMDHPNIARVLDGGATEAGRPYFVMEHVVGSSITKFADAQSLTVKERLDLFQQVCSAVQHAHTKGVIHRDLKPSNVLVSPIDGKPHAKVIDFGIAKATVHSLTEKTLFTEHGQLIGTPEYMSPEQAAGFPDIDTRTDIYSLGVLLYELLTSTTPIDGARLRSAGYEEMRRIIREDDPLVPSMKLTRSQDRLAATAAARKIDPHKLSTIVKGELDWIAMKALEKERGRRYETAIALADDVRRYLNGEAVVAAPPQLGYKLRKLALKYKAVTTVIGVGFAGLVSTIVALYFVNFNAKAALQNAAIATAAKDQAEWNATAANLSLAQAAMNSLDYVEARRLLEVVPSSKRNWEWEFLSKKSQEIDWSIKGDFSEAIFSSDSSFLATMEASRNRIRTWSTDTGAQLRKLDCSFDGTSALTISPDKRRVGTISLFNSRVWNLSSGLQEHEFHPANKPLEPLLTTGEPGALIFSPTSDKLATVVWDACPRVWDLSSGKQLYELEGHSATAICGAFDHKGSILATGSTDGSVRLWDLSNGKSVHVLDVSRHHIRSIQWSNDDQTLLTIDTFGIVKLWSSVQGALLQELNDLYSSVSSAHFNADASRVVLTSAQRIEIIDAVTGEILQSSPELPTEITSSDISNDGEIVVVATADGGCWIWSPQIALELVRLPLPSGADPVISLSPDTKRIACITNHSAYSVYSDSELVSSLQLSVLTVNNVGDTERRWDDDYLLTRRVATLLGSQKAASDFLLSQNHSVELPSRHRRLGILKENESQNRVLHFWDTSFQPERKIAAFVLPDAIENIAITKQEDRLAIRLADGSVCVWDVRNAELRRADLQREWRERLLVRVDLDMLWAKPLSNEELRDRVENNTEIDPLRSLLICEMGSDRLKAESIDADRAFYAYTEKQQDKNTVRAAVQSSKMTRRTKDRVLERLESWVPSAK